MRMRKRHFLLGFIGLLLIVLIVARIYLNGWLLDYVNGALSNIKGYQGSVESIDIALYRGAYRINGLKVEKKTGHIPTPFIAIKTADLSIQWGALFRGRIVSDIDLDTPVLNFAVNPSGTAQQTGAGADWSKVIKDLMPMDINTVTFANGKLTYQDFSTTPKVNIYIDHMRGNVNNLRNVEDASKPLPSTLLVRGDSIGKGALTIKGRMNVLRPIPDLDLDAKIENIDLPALSNYSNAYAAIDIRKGRLSVYSELIIKDKVVSGYIKPIATDIALIDLKKDANPLKFVWQSAVTVVMEIFTNRSKDQFATKIPLSGRLDNIDTDSWATLGGIVRNAFVGAFKKGFEGDTRFDKPAEKE